MDKNSGGSATDLKVILKGFNQETEIFRTLKSQIEITTSMADGQVFNTGYREILELVRSGKVKCFLFLPNSSLLLDETVKEFVEAGIEVVVMLDGFPDIDSTRRMQILHPEED